MRNKNRTELSKKIISLREERDWTQTELSKRSGLDRSTIAYLETDRIASPSAETFIKLAQAFNINVFELFVAAGYIKDLTETYGSEESAESLMESIKLKIRQLDKKLKESKLDEITD